MFWCNSVKCRDSYGWGRMGTRDKWFSSPVFSFWQWRIPGACGLWPAFSICEYLLIQKDILWVLKAHPRSSWPLRWPFRKGPYCRATAGQGPGEDSHSLPRGKMNFNYFSHAAWLFFFIIYNLIMLPLTGVTPGNSPLNVPEEIVFIFPTSSFIVSVLFTPEIIHCFSSWGSLGVESCFPYVGNKNGLYSNFLITFSIIPCAHFTSLKYIIRQIKPTDKAKPLANLFSLLKIPAVKSRLQIQFQFILMGIQDFQIVAD